jgi:hypothetical protein
MFGCDRPTAPRLEFQGLVIDRCPAYYMKGAEWTQFAFQVYSWKEKGILPYSGGFLEQPNIVVEICDFMDHLVAEKMRLIKSNE